MTSTVAAPAVHEGFLEFPESFIFGCATAAYQIEGAAQEGGRKPSIWDDFSRMPGRTHNGHTGDVACDHYHRFRDDVRLMKKLGLKAYRFSISWPRLIPEGEGAVNAEGAKFYSELIDELLAAGIQPWVTLYHWDLPSALEAKFGGWLGRKEDIVPAFGGYARTCFSLFGDRVKNWITLNEPWCSSALGYANGEHAPGHNEAAGTEPYIAGHNMLLSHAEAVRIYRTEFKAEQRGVIGITLNSDWRQPFDPDDERDLQASQRSRDFFLGWFADPIYFGDYPASMRATCGARLPTFTPEEAALLKGSNDFFGLNSYSTMLAKAPDLSAVDDAAGPPTTISMWGKPQSGGYFADEAVNLLKDEGWETTDMGWQIVPWGLRQLLLYIQARYNPTGGIVITENGCAHEPEGTLLRDADPNAPVPKPMASDAKKEDFESETYEDKHRVRFFKAHLAAVHAARTHGADVRGYFAWSLVDNFEWGFGYKNRFGVVRVDYDTQKRTIKSSGRFIADVIRKGGFDAPPKSEQYGGCPFPVGKCNGWKAAAAELLGREGGS